MHYRRPDARRGGRNYTLAIVLIAVGLVLLMVKSGLLGDLDLRELWKTYWPILLVFLGLWLIGRSFRRRTGRFRGDSGGETIRPSTDRIDAEHSFTTAAYDYADRSFTGGRAHARLGKVEIDLRGATIPPGEWTLEAEATMGEIVIYTEYRFPVSVTGSGTLAEVSIFGTRSSGPSVRQEYVSETFAGSPGKLRIVYSISMGAFRIA